MVTATDLQNYETKLVIWDWNGTLLDDTALCFAIANEMRVKRGMPPLPDVDAYRAVFHFPVIDYYREMGYTFETESYEAVSVEFHAEYARRVHTCRLQPHAEETLAALAARGVRQVLLSATGEDRLYGQAALFGLPQYFEQIIGCTNNLAHGKADLAHALIEASGLAPKQAMFIGDTDHDFSIASSIGCRCLLLARGHQLPARLNMLGVPVIGSLEQVTEVL